MTLPTEEDTTPTKAKALAEIEALSFGIFAINDIMRPNETDMDDVLRLTERADDVIAVLTRMRAMKQRTVRLFELVSGDGPVPCQCGGCQAADAL